MKLEDIMCKWDEDAVIDSTELARESLKTPQLHSKYMKMLTAEAYTYKTIDLELKALTKLKHEYYLGILDKETLEEKGWEPNPKRIIKQDLHLYMDSDPDIQRLQTRLEVQKQKLTYLESVIKTLSNRGFLIKNAIDWQKFTSGVG